MNTALMIVALVVIVFVVGFFVGGKWKARTMAAAGLIKGAAITVADTIKDAGKKL